MHISPSPILDQFHVVIKEWFLEKFAMPTPAQQAGWPHIARGKNTLILAPTGSGKTLAAFLVCIDQILQAKLELANSSRPATGIHTLYISPLKALNYDIECNLEEPLTGIRITGTKMGIDVPGITTAVRTGDTSQRDRERILRQPPDLLITTPESLHLMLTSHRARRILQTTKNVIVDEIHALCDNKRGTFLVLLLERLARLTGHNFTRIGLSATQNPLPEIAKFLGGAEILDSGDQTVYRFRPVEIIDTGLRKELDVKIINPVEDMRNLPEQSIWPHIYQQLLQLIRSHRSTLIFANSRRAVERITSAVNELAGTELCRAHHGSVSRTMRHQIEKALKRGELPALVATASLELGIDMGAIDLVVQVESPHDTARALQRVGRAGHLYRSASKGRLVPKLRSDLLEMAVIVRAMTQGNIAPVNIPRNCLDVLAQQIVAMVAMESWPVAALFRWLRQVYSYAELPYSHFIGVLEMLSGRYPSATFKDLRPRISWDRVNNVLHPLPGSQRLAIINGGVIPETGQYGAFLADSKVQLGELEEEFVYETRLGDVIQLGTSKWKVTNILHDRVLVQPASTGPARIPFWKGEFFARSPYLGGLLAQALNEIAARLDDNNILEWLALEFNMDQSSAKNLHQYLIAQRRVAKALPDNTTIIIEGFHDELGDLRVAILSPWGGRIHMPWKLAIISQFRRTWGAEPESYHADTGMLFRTPSENFYEIVRIIKSVTPENVEELVLEELANSAFFGLRFRQNAHRALLLPSSSLRRMPLWLQRMKARDLLEIVRNFDNFPIVMETYRECIHDVFALEQLHRILAQIETGAIKVIVNQNIAPSPFVASLLFEFQAAYQYDYEAPKPGALAAPALDRLLLDELLHPDKIPGLFDEPATRELQLKLSGQAPGYQARTPAELVELLRRLGDLTTDELTASYAGNFDQALALLQSDNRISAFQFKHEWRWISTEEKSLFASAFLLYDSYTRSAQIEIIERYLRNHTWATATEICTRYDLDLAVVQSILTEIQGKAGFVSFAHDRVSKWAFRDNLERLRRTTLARKRREVKACTPTDLQVFLLNWQHFHPNARLSGLDAVALVLEQLQGLYLPGITWDSEILGRRIIDYKPTLLDEMINSGTVVWIGKSGSSMGAGQVALFFRENLLLLQPPTHDHDYGDFNDLAGCLRELMKVQGATFLVDLAQAAGIKPSECATVLWQMIWAGEVTNDTFRIIRSGQPPQVVPGALNRVPRSYRARPASMHSFRGAERPRLTGSSGRWSLLPIWPGQTPEKKLEALTWQLLNRYGVLFRELLQLEELDTTWSAFYDLLVRLEWRGEIRRGYFVEGFSGAQFAMPGAFERLLQQPATTAGEEFILINAVDPANLFGAAAPIPINHPVDPQWRFLRHPNNFLIMQKGRPLVAIENRGRRLTLLRDLDSVSLEHALAKLPEMLYDPAGIRRIKSIRVETWNGIPVRASEIVPILLDLGFQTEMQSMVLFRQIT